MEIRKELQDRFSKKPAKSGQMHSPAHLLADELSKKLGEPRRFGFYLKLAVTHDHNILRRIMGQVMESNPKKPGALFTFLLKKESTEKKQ